MGNMHNKWQTLPIAAVIVLSLSSASVVFAQHVISNSDSESMAYLSMRQGKNKEAVSFLNKAIAASPDKAELYVNRSSCFLNLKDTKRALADLNKAEALMKDKKNAPNSVSLFHYNRGAIYLELKRDKDALKEMQLAVDAFPFNAGAEYQLGKLYLKLGKKDLALKYLSSARESYVASKSSADVTVVDKEIAKAKALK